MHCKKAVFSDAFPQSESETVSLDHRRYNSVRCNTCPPRRNPVITKSSNKKIASNYIMVPKRPVVLRGDIGRCVVSKFTHPDIL